MTTIEYASAPPPRMGGWTFASLVLTAITAAEGFLIAILCVSTSLSLAQPLFVAAVFATPVTGLLAFGSAFVSLRREENRRLAYLSLAAIVTLEVIFLVLVRVLVKLS